MKRAVLIFFLVGFCKVFASFEFNMLGQITASTSFPIMSSTGSDATTPTTTPEKVIGSTEAIFGGSLQIGNQFAITSKRLRGDRPLQAPIFNRGNQYSSRGLKGVSVLFDIRFEQETIVLGANTNFLGTNTTDYNRTVSKVITKISGFNLGAGLATKFVIGSVNSLVPRDTIVGFGLGAKILVNSPHITLTGIPVITPYFEVFVEQRFFVARKFAFVCGINIGADMVIARLNYGLDGFFLDYNADIMPIYPSLNIGVSLGLHFGH